MPGKKKSSKKSKAASSVAAPARKTFHVLVIDAAHKPWSTVFAGLLASSPFDVAVHQATWDNLIVSACAGARPVVAIRHQGTVQPDFVLVRQLVDRLTVDYRSVLMALLVSNVPAVNSLHSVFMCLERPVLYSALWGLRLQLGADVFPTIPLEIFSHSAAMRIPSVAFPLVAKVGNAEAGYGKMLFTDSGQAFDDFRGLMAMTEPFVTLESFVADRDYDLRIQKIGAHYRAYKRQSLCGSWKTNVGSSRLEEVPMTDEYRRWADAAASLFGGMDILTVDALHTAAGAHHIIEINDCASGLAPENEQEDMRHIADLVNQRLAAIFAS